MERFDLIIVGTGSGNSLITPDYDHLRIAIVERGVFGGTCLNRGCIPSKMLIYPADIVEQVRHGARLGVDATVDAVRWPDLVARVFGRIDPIAVAGEQYREGLGHVTVCHGHGRFVDHKVIDVDGRRITADTIVLAAGARPHLPSIVGLDTVAHHTSDTVMRLPELPRRLVILGGGYIACELAHVFDAAGSQVTMVLRGDRMLRGEDHEVSDRFTELYRQRFDVRMDSGVAAVRPAGDGDDHEMALTLSDGSELTADAFLIATGRVPNSDELDVAATGVAVDDDGYVVVDEHQRTNVDGIWALGDISNPAQLKHVANAEARVVSHNIIHPDHLRTVETGAAPHAVFANPQVAGVGATEHQLIESGVPHVVSVRSYADTAYGWAMEDTTSFAKVMCHRDTRQILGAHILGPQAATLVQPLVQAMRFGQTADQLAHDLYYIHPALTEVVEQALLGLERSGA